MREQEIDEIAAELDNDDSAWEEPIQCIEIT
jgi:hypothetical protein